MERAGEKWSQIEESLPQDLDEKQKVWLRSYFKAQIALLGRDFTEARKILTRLGNEDGFNEFEDSHDGLFADLDVRVRGQTNRNKRFA